MKMGIKETLEKYIVVTKTDPREVQYGDAKPWCVDITIPNDPRELHLELLGHFSKAVAEERRDKVIEVLELVIQDLIEDLGLMETK